MPIEAKIVPPNLGATSPENSWNAYGNIVIGQFTADSRVGARNQCTPAD